MRGENEISDDFPTDEEGELFAKEMIEKLKNDAKILEEAVKYEETEEDYKDEVFIEIEDETTKKVNLDHLRYNEDGKILIDSLPD